MLRAVFLKQVLPRPVCSVTRPYSARRRQAHLVCSAAHMLSPPELAARRAGLTLEQAFAVDQVNLYDRLGAEPLKRLAREFYDRVYADGDEFFHKVFASSPKEGAIRNNYEFVIQRLGGPPLYSERKGHPALPRHHAPHDCSEATAERYMLHMDAALAAVPEIDDDSRERLSAYFRHTCYFLVVAQEMRQSVMVQQQQQAAPAGRGVAAAQQAAPGGCPAHAAMVSPAAGQA